MKGWVFWLREIEVPQEAAESKANSGNSDTL
jgi:hypothetical protein